MFDCPQISEGAALLRALIWIKQYGEVYGAPASEMNAVIVVRHAAIAMIMDDEFWDHHKLGRELKITDPKTRAPIARNPFFGPTPFADLPAGLADDALGRALKVGTILACNLAFQDMVETVKKQAKVDDIKAREMALRHVVPGVRLQPRGSRRFRRVAPRARRRVEPGELVAPAQADEPAPAYRRRPHQAG